MPRHQPFTRMCQQAAALARRVVADLHTHTTSSDGDYTPSQLVSVAWKAGLEAVAITDHDTLAGFEEAANTAVQFTSRPIRVIPGVEITTSHRGHTVHLLAYGPFQNRSALDSLLLPIQAGRRERFRKLLAILESEGIHLEPWRWEQLLAQCPSPGRRHLASLLVQANIAPTRNQAFRRHLLKPDRQFQPAGVPTLADALMQVVEAGGVSSLAHPPDELTFADLTEMAEAGLMAVEARFPACRMSRTQELQDWCKKLALLSSGGSDCHGPEGSVRAVGSCGLSGEEWRILDSKLGQRSDSDEGTSGVKSSAFPVNTGSPAFNR